MKKIVLKISLLLIASSFSVQLYPAASAAKTPDELQALVKQHTKQKLTPAQRAEEYAKLSSEERTALGGGAAPAEKSFSDIVKFWDNAILSALGDIARWKSAIKLEKKIMATGDKNSELLIKKYTTFLEKAYKDLSERTEALKNQLERERLDREMKSEKTE